MTTKEQKAQEIADNNKDYYPAVGGGFPLDSYEECERSALKMAEWKDQEFLKLIDSKLDYARSKIEERHDKLDRIKYEGMRKILLEIMKNIKKK